MTETVPRLAGPTAAPAAGASPRRATLVAMAGAILVVYVVMLAMGADLSYDDPLADIADAYDQSRGAMQISSYAGMAFVALLLFFGAALRSALRNAPRAAIRDDGRSGARGWLADVTLLGFGGLAATIATWVVTDLAMWKAVDYGDESTIRTVAVISDAGFLPLMAAMVAVYLGTGLAGLATGAIPKWLAIASIVVGVLAPLGPLGFVGATLLPLWVVAIALTIRLTPAP